MKTKTPEGSMDFTPTFIISFLVVEAYYVFWPQILAISGAGRGKRDLADF